MSLKKTDIAVVIVNWNTAKDSLACIDRLQQQSQTHTIIAVDNGSTDTFVSEIKRQPDIVLVAHTKNLGFTGGVNAGMRHALAHNFRYVALINSDAKPEKHWLRELVSVLEADRQAGIATGKLLKTDGTIDSTGDNYTAWGLAYPRGRDTEDRGQYDAQEYVFGASGGASVYRIAMLEKIGLMDDDFFAYYEDVDLSFRAQRAGWKTVYNPTAVAHHKVGETSKKIPNLTTYMTIKNLPWLFWKNVPARLMIRMLPRFTVAYSSIVVSSLAKGKIVPVAKGLFVSTILMPKKLWQRRSIQKNSVVTTDYIKDIITDDLPPNAHKLRRLRSFFVK